MCGKCLDYKVINAKQNEVSFFKFNLVILVLFSITCSALGLSCYALLRVQNLSDDLNTLRQVLSRTKVQTLNDGIVNFSDHEIWGDNPKRPIDEAPILRNIVRGELSERRKRNSIEEIIDSAFKTEDLSTTDEIEEEVTIYDSTTKPSSTDNPEYPLHLIKKKAVNYEVNTDTESFSPEYVQHNIYRNRQNGRNNNQLEIIDEFSPRAGRLKSLIAIHFNGDTSKYVYGQHSNFNGNGHLRHPKKTFVDWKESDWVDSIGTGSNFARSNGIVTIKESGLYFVYAQIYYMDEHDTNGYRVFKNSEILLQCTTTSHSSQRMMKGNTCYTAGVTYLDTNETISVSDITDGRYSLFEPGKSFFGIIRLGDAKLK